MGKRSFGNKLVSGLISRIKKSDYSLDEAISGGELLGIISDRGFMFIRGIIRKPFLKKADGILFVGKSVKIQSGKKIRIGSGSTLHSRCRVNALSKSGITIGRNFTLGPDCIIECSGVISELGEGLVIGDNVGISAKSFIGVRGSVSIGSDTIIGPYCSIHAENHTFRDMDTLIRQQPSSRKGIEIGSNCWIGAKTVILDGVKIGNGCIIAAGAVVTKSIPDNSVAAGIPAKVIKVRSKDSTV